MQSLNPSKPKLPNFRTAGGWLSRQKWTWLMSREGHSVLPSVPLLDCLDSSKVKADRVGSRVRSHPGKQPTANRRPWFDPETSKPGPLLCDPLTDIFCASLADPSGSRGSFSSRLLAPLRRSCVARLGATCSAPYDTDEFSLMIWSSARGTQEKAGVG